MEATALVKAQHQEMKELFEYFDLARDRATKVRIFVRLADKLAAHASMEEALFYPVARPSDEQEEDAEQARFEHETMRRLVGELLDMRLSDPQFRVRFKLLRELVLRHAIEEEATQFARVRARMSGEQLLVLGQQMEAHFDRVLEGRPLEDESDVLGETAYA